jgi:hypothetical protein
MKRLTGQMSTFPPVVYGLFSLCPWPWNNLAVDSLSAVGPESRPWLAPFGRYGTLDLISPRMKDSTCRISP